MVHLDHRSRNASDIKATTGTPQPAIPPASSGHIYSSAPTQHGEVIEIDHDMLLDTEANMTAAGSNTMALEMDLLDKTEPIFTTQQDIQIDTPIEGYH